MAPEHSRTNQGEAGKVLRGWIYKLPREELIAELETVGLATDGLVDDLRRRLSIYVAEHPELYRQAHTGEEAGTNTATEIEIPSSQPGGSGTIPRVTIMEPENNAKVINQIRKWGCHFDEKDPESFLERVEELREGYDISGCQLLRGLPELLKGDALAWYRNNRENWTSWGEFCKEFREYHLPARYNRQLLREIQARFQQPEEAYRKFATELTTMMRRAGGFSAEAQLEMLYENMHPKYKMHIPFSSITRTGELFKRAEELEQLEIQCRERAKPPKPAPAAAVTYDRRECCWRCKQRGHTRFDCKRIPRKFCSRCGKDGVLTRDCHPPPGNAAGTE